MKHILRKISSKLLNTICKPYNDIYVDHYEITEILSIQYLLYFSNYQYYDDGQDLIIEGKSFDSSNTFALYHLNNDYTCKSILFRGCKFNSGADHFGNFYAETITFENCDISYMFHFEICPSHIKTLVFKDMTFDLTLRPPKDVSDSFNRAKDLKIVFDNCKFDYLPFIQAIYLIDRKKAVFINCEYIPF